MKFFLLGFMGTGKSYWGKSWSAQFQLDFFDLDHEVETMAGLSVAGIFEKLGESYFREKERDILHSFGTKDDFILSCGGGTPCFYDNMEWMNSHGITIFISTPIPILKERLILEKSHRPLIQSLTDEALEEFIRRKLKEREKYYGQAAIILPSESISHATFAEIIKRYV
jgi:shikimate kinase